MNKKKHCTLFPPFGSRNFKDIQNVPVGNLYTSIKQAYVTIAYVNLLWY